MERRLQFWRSFHAPRAREVQCCTVSSDWASGPRLAGSHSSIASSPFTLAASHLVARPLQGSLGTLPGFDDPLPYKAKLGGSVSSHLPQAPRKQEDDAQASGLGAARPLRRPQILAQRRGAMAAGRCPRWRGSVLSTGAYTCTVCRFQIGRLA